MKNNFIIFLFFLLFSFSAKAKIITSDWPYLKIYEKLISCGVISPPFYGQRLWSEKRIYKAIKTAKTSQNHSYCSDKTLAVLFDQIAAFEKKEDIIQKKSFYANWLRNVEAEYFFLSGGDTNYSNNNSGLINAIINTFRENQQGRLLGIGHNISFHTEHELRWKTLKFTGFLEPRADLLFHNKLQNIDDYRLTLHQGYAFFDLWKLQILIGRVPLIWGQGQYGGLLFSENARPLDHLQITHHPFQFPWLFKHLGKWKFSYIFGTLGPEQFFPWTMFTGLSIGLKPIEELEFNLSHVIHFGGESSPDLDFQTGVQEFFGFIPFISQSSKGGSNKLTSLNARFFLSKLWGFQGYVEYFMDDSNLSGGLQALKKHFFHNSSYKVGLYLTRFLNSIDDSLRLDFTSTAPIAYRHGPFQSGWTINQNIIGDALGPDGLAISLQWQHDWSTTQKTILQTQWINRNSDRYSVTPDGLRVSVSNPQPNETRLPLEVIYKHDFLHFTLDTSLGYEYTHNYQFIQDNSQNTLFFGLKLRKDFDL